MKNGFNYKGGEAEVLGGLVLAALGPLQVGMPQGQRRRLFLRRCAQRQRLARPLAVAAAAFLRRRRRPRRQQRVPSQLHRRLNSSAPPRRRRSRCCNERWSAVYTTPQTYKNQLAFLNATGSIQLSDTLSLKGNVYFRGFRQKHVDGNTSDVVPCARSAGLPLPRGGRRLAVRPHGSRCRDVLAAPRRARSTAPGRWRTAGAARCRRRAPSQVLGHNNNFVVGASLDRGRVNFRAVSELGTIGPDLFVTGTGVIIAQPDGWSRRPISRPATPISGVYVTDTFDVTSQMSITAGGRFNLAQIKLKDQLGTALNGRHQFSALQPGRSARPPRSCRSCNAYAGYSEANRAPTPAELACADPDAAVPARQFPRRRSAVEAGGGEDLRSGIARPIRSRPKERARRLEPRAGSIRRPRTTSSTSPARSPAAASFRTSAPPCARESRPPPPQSDRWNVYASYNYIDATFQDTLTLAVAGQSLRRRRLDHGASRQRHPARSRRTASRRAPNMRSPRNGRPAPT